MMIDSQPKICCPIQIAAQLAVGEASPLEKQAASVIRDLSDLVELQGRLLKMYRYGGGTPTDSILKKIVELKMRLGGL